MDSEPALTVAPSSVEGGITLEFDTLPDSTSPMFAVEVPGLGYALKFKDVDAVRAWADTERAFWQPLFPQPKILNPWLGNEIVNRQTQVYDGLHDPDKIQSTLNRLSEGCYVVSTSPAGPRIKKLAEEDPVAGILLLGYHQGTLNEARGGKWNDFPRLIGYAYYAARAATAETGALVRDSEKAAYAAQRRRFEDSNEECEKDWDDFLTGSSITFDEMVQSHGQAMYEIQDKYEKRMQLQSASTYWREKEKQHKKAAFWGLIGFTVLVSIIVGLIFYDGAAYLGKLPKNAQGDIGLAAIGAVTIPALLVFWLLRHVSRFFVTHFNQREDARQRRALVTTYLALHHKEKASDKERLLILNALFRPHAAEKEDDPAAASLLDNLAKSLK